MCDPGCRQARSSEHESIFESRWIKTCIIPVDQPQFLEVLLPSSDFCSKILHMFKSPCDIASGSLLSNMSSIPESDGGIFPSIR